GVAARLGEGRALVGESPRAVELSGVESAVEQAVPRHAAGSGIALPLGVCERVLEQALRLVSFPQLVERERKAHARAERAMHVPCCVALLQRALQRRPGGLALPATQV